MTETLPPDAADRLADIARAAQADMAKAIQLARSAKAEGVRAPLVHHLVARGLKDEGRLDEAIAELGLGLQLAPNEAGLMTEVGFCLIQLGRHADAARVFEAAIRADAAWAPSWYGYGWVAERLGALDQAKSAWERAVSLAPRNADALAGLAGLAARRRDWDAAESLAESALAADPDQTDALTHLAHVELGKGDIAAAEARVRDLAGRSNLAPEARANARLLLGDVLDAAGRYEEAFAAYAEGKAALAEFHALAFAGPGEPTSAEVARDMAEEFRSTTTESWAAPSRTMRQSGARGHAFLIGFPRSGTTLLEQVIATHPDMAALGERPVLAEAAAEFLSSAGGMERLSATVSDLLEPYREDYWRRVRQFGVDVERKVFVDKHPLGGLQLPLVAKVFPDARVIFVRRDPRDVALSCFRRGFKMSANIYEFTSLERAARFYDAVMSATELYLERLPLSVLRLRHEDLVADFEGETRRLCDFLDVAWTPELANFADTERTIATPSSTQIARGLYPESVGQWRNYAFALEPVTPILAPWIEAFGYPPE